MAGVFVYLYLFLSVPNSFKDNLGNVSAHPALAVVIVVGGAVLIVIVARLCWRQVKKLWAQAKQGGVILSTPRGYFTRAFLPSFLSYVCKFVVIGIFLAAFAIPVTFDSLMWIVGSGSLANVASFTPGAVGVTQATNRRARHLLRRPEEHDRRLFDRPAADHDRLERGLRAGPRISVFGWTGGKQLVSSS